MTFSTTNFHNLGIRLVFGAMLLLFMPLGLQADGLDTEKATLLVGEQWDGYLGAVHSDTSPELRTLISSINEKRRTQYLLIAQKNNISLANVEMLAAKKTFQRTLPGHMVKTETGGWQKK